MTFENSRSDRAVERNTDKMADEEVNEIITKLNSRHNIEKLDGLKTVLRVSVRRTESVVLAMWFHTMAFDSGWPSMNDESPGGRAVSIGPSDVW